MSLVYRQCSYIMTNLMNRAVTRLYSANSTDGISRSTINALHTRGLIKDDCKLTEFGERYVISRMSLKRQCQELGLELVEMHLQYQGRPEPALLRYFESEGHVGCCLEGGGILTVLKALMLEKLEKHNTFHDRADACARYLQAQLVIQMDKSRELVDSIRETDKTTYLRNWTDIVEHPFIRLQYPGLSVEFAEAMFDAIGTEEFVRLAEKMFEDPYSYASGWPDLTLVKAKKVQFIEVKTSDRLHESQLITIPKMREVLPFKFSVYRLLEMSAESEAVQTNLVGGG